MVWGARRTPDTLAPAHTGSHRLPVPQSDPPAAPPQHRPPTPADDYRRWAENILDVLRDIRAELAAARTYRSPVFADLVLNPGAAPTRLDYRGYKHCYLFVGTGTPAMLTNMLGQPTAYTLAIGTWNSITVPDGVELSVAAGGAQILGMLLFRDTPLP